VDAFIPCSDYFTIDIADSIGKSLDPPLGEEFLAAMKPYRGSLEIPGMRERVEITDPQLEGFARKYLHAIRQAGKVYRHIAERKGPDRFITEISADEAQSAQTPVDMLLLLAAIAREGIPIQAIAPKFTGAFLKGTDYVGDPNLFDRQFRDDLAVIAFAVDTFSLPRNLKLSIHTGSDKFTLYPLMHRAIKEAGAGIHLKTAGTTWLEEAAGLAASGGEGLALVKDIYERSFRRCDNLCEPYLAVISIEKSRLPLPEEVSSWSSGEFIEALRHDPRCPAYNRHFRQLLHVGFKVAAETGERFRTMLMQCRSVIEENVTRNLFENHIRPLYLGDRV